MSDGAPRDDDPAAAGLTPPVAGEQPVFEGEAVELPAEAPLASASTFEPPPLTVGPSSFDPMPFPIADEPIAVVTPGSEPNVVTSLGDAGEAYATGHAASPGPSWQEPVMKMADERPELVVGAAFAGGLLAAMILRRLGN